MPPSPWLSEYMASHTRRQPSGSFNVFFHTFTSYMRIKLQKKWKGTETFLLEILAAHRNVRSWGLRSSGMLRGIMLVSKVNVQCTLVQALRLCTGRTAHWGSRGIALPFLDHGTRRGWEVSFTLRPLFTPGKDPVPIVQEAKWAPGIDWTDRKISSPPRFDPRTVQPVTSRYTDYAIRPTAFMLVVVQYFETAYRFHPHDCTETSLTL